jgi:hypothetical protein
VENVTEARGIEVRSIEVRYAGVVVGRSTKVRDWGDGGAFIGFAEPLPSGTSLVLKGDGIEQAARVIEVIESADPAVAGMQVKFIGAAEAVRPAPMPAAASAPARASEPPRVTAPAPAAAPAPPLTAAPAPELVAEAEPAEISETTSSAEQGQENAEDAGQGGQPGSGGKRRRRRR